MTANMQPGTEVVPGVFLLPRYVLFAANPEAGFERGFGWNGAYAWAVEYDTLVDRVRVMSRDTLWQIVDLQDFSVISSHRDCLKEQLI